MPIPKHLYLLPTLLCLSSPLWALDKIIEPPMVTIKAGEFRMGYDGWEKSKPAHKVTIKAFKLGKYEVTVKEFAQFIAATKYVASNKCRQFSPGKGFAETSVNWQADTLSSSDYQPVVCIGWDAAQAYVQWLAKETGKHYRLPSEAEWEYAHRAGSTTKYFFGSDDSQVCRHGNTYDYSGAAALKRDNPSVEVPVSPAPCDDQAEYTTIVGMYEPNAFGLHDIFGNVSEYVQDCGHDNYVGAPDDGSAWIQGECKARVTRDTNWHWPSFDYAMRGDLPPDFYGSLEGFRIAEDIEVEAEGSPEHTASVFETALADAQQAERERRKKLPAKI